MEVPLDVNGDTLFQVAGPDIVHDAIDDGIVVVNLTAGAYFTLDGTAREIWELLVSGRTRGEIAADLARRYDARPPEILNGVDGLLTRLVEEGLVVAAGEARARELPTAPEGTVGRPFAAPELVKYTDLEDLLTLDPIHEVDDAGWPQIKPPKSL